MKTFVLTLLMGLWSVMAWAQFDQAPAFPGAEGFGRYVSGGRGGAVYHVTKLTDDGSEGTLRWAINKSGRRTIVFDVSGTIYLKSELQLKNANVSILGQTAPGDGICIADYPFTIKASNVIIRYVRFRLGNRNVANHEGDGLGGMDQSNIIIDHCSVSWSIDECLSVYGSKNISVQWNIVDQSLVNSGHSKGAHGYGGNWGGSGASYHHNLIAHHTSRTPRLGPRPGTQCDERMDMRNNVIYNWGGNGCYGGEGMNVNIVNNYYKPGPGTRTRSANIQKRIAAPGIRTTEYTKHGTAQANDWDKMWHVWGKYYVTGNYNPDYSDVSNDNWTYGIYNQIDASGNDGTYTQRTKDTIRIDQPIPYGYITTQRASVGYQKVCDYAGASFHRDSHDAYIVSDVINGVASHCAPNTKTGFIDNQDQAGGWPELEQGDVPADTDRDGMPDEWEQKYGLNPADASDRNLYSLDSRGFYTNLEVYCNSLVESQIREQNQNALADVDGAFEEYYPDYKATESGSEDVSVKVIYCHPGTKGNKLTFDDGATLQITGNESKMLEPVTDITVGSGAYKGIKLSNGAQNTFVCPSGRVASRLTLYSFVNADPGSRTSYWAEVNGEMYNAGGTDGASDAVILQSYRDAAHPDSVSFSLPSVSSFTFTNTGEQLCFVMEVTLSDATSLSSIRTIHSQARDVRSLSGQLILRDAAPEQFEALPRGAYIYGNRIVVK